jgi:hypothetical protein
MGNEFLKKEQKVLLLILIFFFILSPRIAKGENPLDNFLRTIGGGLEWLKGQIWQGIANILAFIGATLYRIAVFIFAFLGFIFSLIGIYLGWAVVPAITNALIKISLNMDVYNAINGVWESVRTFSLQLVEIFLLIIGLLTIFRIREYEARKTLVWLIIAALLVSFSLNIGKKLIEWGNKFTTYVANYFFGISGDNYFPDFSIVYSTLANRLWEYFGKIWEFFTKDGDLHKFFTVYLWVFALDSLSYWIFAILSFYISFVLLALGIVFLLRMVYLICLLVVSPIAFLTAGLRTKEIKQIFGGFLNWDGWWPAFLEWVFIGMVLIIWLGVGVKIYENFPKPSSLTLVDCSKVFSGQAPEIQQSCEEQGAIISELFPWSLPVLALAVAIHIGMKTSPGIIKQAVGGIIATVGFITTAAVAAGTAAITAGASAAASGAGALESIKTAFKHGAGTFAGRLAAGVPEMKKVLPEELRPGFETAAASAEEFEKRVGLVRRMRRPLIYSEKEAEEEVERTFKEEGVKGVLALAENPLVSAEVRKKAIEMAMEKGFDKGEEWIKDKNMQKLMLRMYEEAAKKGDKKTMALMERKLVRSLAEDSELRKRFMEIGFKHGILKEEEYKDLTEEAKAEKYLAGIVKGIKSSDDAKQLQKGAVFNNTLREVMLKELTGYQWGLIGREIGKGLVDALEPKIEEIKSLSKLPREQLREVYETEDIVEAYKKIIWSMPGLARYSETAAAQELGISSFYEIAPDEVKRRYRNMREILAEKPPAPPPPITPTEREKMKEELRKAEEKIREEEKKEGQK